MIETSLAEGLCRVLGKLAACGTGGDGPLPVRLGDVALGLCCVKRNSVPEVEDIDLGSSEVDLLKLLLAILTSSKLPAQEYDGGTIQFA